MGIRGLLDNLRSRRAAPRKALELLAVEGMDVGRRFTLSANEIRIVRGHRDGDDRRRLFLRDPTVSTSQGWIRHSDGGYQIEHDPSATNPTLVNDQLIALRRIRAGDHIQIGRVVLEVQNPAASVSGIFEPPRVDGEGLEGVETTVGLEYDTTAAGTAQIPADETLHVSPYGLTEVRGQHRRSFPLPEGDTVIGRLTTCDIAFPDEPAISRQHARIERANDTLTLVQLSQVNPTRVNGRNVAGQAPLDVGDEIEVAGCVGLQVVGPARAAREPARPAPVAAPAGLAGEIEELIAQNVDIEARFAVEGSFLDVDVVKSFQMKSDTPEAERIILSFERWRGWIMETIRDHRGDVLNSNGDELMCFFEEAIDALRAGHAILSELGDFNAKSNLLARPFRLRIGIHTGRSLVDRTRGVAYSPVLDIAGHLQKDAAINGLLLSEETQRALPEKREAGFTLRECGVVDGLRAFALTETPASGT